MKLTSKGRFAVMSLVDISINSVGNKPVSLSEISNRQNISLPFLEQIFISLKKSGIVKSVRGPSGGYTFAKNPDFIKIYDDRKFEPKLFDDTMPTLNKLKESGCTHSVLSAQNIVTLKKSVSHYQLDEMFESISGLEDHYAIGKVEQGKNLIQNLDFQLDEVAMIGDTEHDHEVAEAMGIKCFLMDRGHNSTNRLKSKTSKVLSSFTELMEEIS